MPQVHRKTQEDDLLDGKYPGKKILSILRADCRTRLHSGALFPGLHGQRRIILILNFSDHSDVSGLSTGIGQQFVIIDGHDYLQ